MTLFWLGSGCPLWVPFTQGMCMEVVCAAFNIIQAFKRALWRVYVERVEAVLSNIHSITVFVWARTWKIHRRAFFDWCPLGDRAPRYPLGILKQHQTSKGAAVVLHVLICIYKVQSRDLKCKAPNSYGLRWLSDCTPAARTFRNTEHWVRSYQICPCSWPLYRLGKGKACIFFTFCLRCRQKTSMGAPCKRSKMPYILRWQLESLASRSLLPSYGCMALAYAKQA